MVDNADLSSGPLIDLHSEGVRPNISCFRRRKQFNSSVKPAIGSHTKSNKTGRPGISLSKQIGGLNKSKIRKMSKYKQTNQQSSTNDFKSVAQ